jgi:hypothetical protein
MNRVNASYDSVLIIDFFQMEHVYMLIVQEQGMEKMVN